MTSFFQIGIIVLIGLNIIAFILTGLDKYKSVDGQSRIPEIYLFFWAAIFGSLGVLVGMLVFRHKVRKWYFPVGIGAILLQQIILVALIYTGS